jgi:hypothetical protein
MMVRALLAKKVFRDHRAPGGGIVVAIDGTGVSTFDQDPGGTTSRTCRGRKGRKGEARNDGKTLYFHYVLEAKVVTPCGLSISVATVWVENVGEGYDKQDCEMKAFVRLAAKLKADFPRLRMCIAADGLYPNATFFGACRDNGWDFVVTLKDGSLKSVWEEMGLRPRDPQQTRVVQQRLKLRQTYKWVTGLDHDKFSLNVVECVEEATGADGAACATRFAHVTNLGLDSETAPKVSQAGRLRWKIENEGFRAQKHEGYNLGHKFSRVSFNAVKNYYQCLQIAHMINQLALHSTTINDMLDSDPKLTLAHLWEMLIMLFYNADAMQALLHQDPGRRCQIRLA